MNVRGVITAASGVLVAASLLVPAPGFAYDRGHSGAGVSVGYREHYGDRYYGGHHRRHSYYPHLYGHPPHGRAYGHYAPHYPGPHHYRPHYPGHHYYPAPRHHYGPNSGWSLDLHYFFRN